MTEIERATAFTKQSLGRDGENAAIALLEREGYRIIDTNVRFGAKSGVIGEVDIVAWDNETLCFVEVKTRRGVESSPGEAVTAAKIQRIVHLADYYIAQSENILGGDLAIRFDVVTVAISFSKMMVIDLIRGAFTAEAV